jgi:hypothetical protein
MDITRRDFIKTSAMVTAGSVLAGVATAQQPDRPAALADPLVKDFVSVCHGDFAKVKEMLAAEPRLLHASWDWGGGDFESGIEAAGHVGNREIADFLIEKGARVSVFQYAMMGELEIVKGLLTKFPAMRQSKGPHGLSLVHHAKRGGDKAAPVLAYLESLGLK